MELQQTAGDPASQQFRCAAHTPFPHHIPPMMFDRAWTNSIDSRDLFIGKTAPNTLKDFAFPNGQCSGPLAPCQPFPIILLLVPGWRFFSYE